MKKGFQKIGMAIVAFIMFTGIMLLSVEKNRQGQWKFSTLSSLAQGGENGGGEEGDDEPLECPTGNVPGTYTKQKVETGIIVCVNGKEYICDKYKLTFQANAAGDECVYVFKLN